ncbi:hypothetical protein DRQ36_09240, partial [bacterium]
LAEAIAQLEETEKILEQYRDRLEEKVELRTRELTLARDELAKNLEKLRRIMKGIVLTIVRMVEAKDPYTAGHQQRVSKLAVAIAKKLGLPEDQVNCIETASILHDIGKINVPAEILTKPGKLDDIEFMLIKMHSATGYEILKSIEFPWPVAEIVLQHHERMDGGGYPKGLKGDEISLEALIIGVADVVEAMATHRPYRPSLGIEAALSEITEGAGKRYDPDIVNACIALFEEGYEL